MPFESGTFTTRGGKTVNFVRVVNVKEVIEQMVEELIESNSLKSPENINENTLYISLLGDKGGTRRHLNQITFTRVKYQRFIGALKSCS